MARASLLFAVLATGCFEKIDILAGTPLSPTDAGLPKAEAQRCTTGVDDPEARDGGSSTRTCAFPRDPTGKIEAVVGSQQCVGGFWTECKAERGCSPLPAGYPCLSSMLVTCTNWPCACQTMRCVASCEASFGSGPTGNPGLVFDAACATACGAPTPVFCPITSDGCDGAQFGAELARLCGSDAGVVDAGVVDVGTEPHRDLPQP